MLSVREDAITLGDINVHSILTTSVELQGVILFAESTLMRHAIRCQLGNEDAALNFFEARMIDCDVLRHPVTLAKLVDLHSVSADFLPAKSLAELGPGAAQLPRRGEARPWSPPLVCRQCRFPGLLNAQPIALKFGSWVRRRVHSHK